MKKGWKVFWITCAITAGIGVVCCAAAFGLGVTVETMSEYFPYGIGWVDRRSVDASKYIAEDIVESYQEVNEIDMDIAAGKVEILVSDSPDVRVETDGISEKLKFRCYMDGRELKLETSEHIRHIVNAGIGTIYLYVPREMRFDEVSMQVGVGELYVESVCARDLSVKVGAGSAVIDEFRADEAGFECGTGEIAASGDVERELDIETGVGNIECNMAGSERDYNYDIGCDIGQVTCGEREYSGLARNTEIDNHAGKSMDIECGIGNVTVNFR